HQAWSRATLALFHRDAERAYRAIGDAWRSLQRSGMLRLEAVAGDLRYLRARCALAAARARTAAARSEPAHDAAGQARWLRRSTLAHGAAIADAIEVQLAALDGRDDERERSRARAAGAALRELGLAPDGNALERWAN